MTCLFLEKFYIFSFLLVTRIFIHAAERNTLNKKVRLRRATDNELDKQTLIPGTFLNHNQYYHVSMKRFPGEYLTWIMFQQQPDYRYVQLFKTDNHPKLEMGSHWYTSIQWKFVETDEPGWYYLVNRDHPWEYAKCSTTEKVKANSFYLVLDSNHDNFHTSKEDFFFKPVQSRNIHHYQLKIKMLPRAVITWVNQTNWDLTDTRYIQVVNNSLESLGNRAGNIGFDDTLFIFEEVEEDTTTNLHETLTVTAFLVGIIIYGVLRIKRNIEI